MVRRTGLRSGATVQLKDLSALCPAVSVAVTVAVPMPGVLGVPENRRESDIVTPTGKSATA